MAFNSLNEQRPRSHNNDEAKETLEKNFPINILLEEGIQVIFIFVVCIKGAFFCILIQYY